MIGVWDRIFTNGVVVPSNVVDRDTASVETLGSWFGVLIRERDGRELEGHWTQDGTTVTETFGADVTVWTATREFCVDGSDACLVFRRPDQVDWFRSRLDY